MSEPKLTIPHTIGWTVLASVLTFLITAVWVGRGAYAELQAVREYAASLATEQKSTTDRVYIIERAMSRNDVQMEWIMKALERQERRNGYVPPPLPPNGN